MKTAIIIMSDPKSGSEEALGRVFNALALASECKQKGDEVAVVFNGPARGGLASSRSSRIRPMVSIMRFAMWCKAPLAAVRRCSERRKVSSRAGCRWSKTMRWPEPRDS